MALGKQASLLSPPCYHTPIWFGRALVAVLQLPRLLGLQRHRQQTLPSGFLFRSHDWLLKRCLSPKICVGFIRKLGPLNPPTGSQQLPLRQLPVCCSCLDQVPGPHLPPSSPGQAAAPHGQEPGFSTQALRCHEPSAPGPLLQVSGCTPCAPEQAWPWGCPLPSPLDSQQSGLLSNTQQVPTATVYSPNVKSLVPGRCDL